MNDNDHDTEVDVFDRRLDWAVGELGGRKAPDVTDAVMGRIDGVPSRAHSKNVWLAAALVVFGLSAVFAVVWTKSTDEARQEAQDGQQDGEQDGQNVRQRLLDMPCVVVRTRAELDALPQDTQGVELIGMGFEEVDALLKRCPYVRKLRLRGDTVEGGTVFRAMWFRHLRHLDIAGCANVPERVIAEMVKDPELLQVRFGGQRWLKFEHLELLAKSGIEPILPEQVPIARLVVAELVRDYGEQMRERQLTDLQPVPFHVVRSIEDIAALPADTGAVDGIDLEDEAVGALARLKNLRHLRLRSGVQAKLVPLLDLDAPYPRNTGEANRNSVTDVGLAQLVPLQRLETIDLAGTVEVKGPGIRHLARLPALRELGLICIDTSDEGLSHLPDFPALRSLRLEWNHGFGAPGMQAIGRCLGLASLVLDGCPQLGGDSYESLLGLVNLRELRIRRPGDVAASWRDDSARELTSAENEVLIRARQQARAADGGVTDAVLAMLVQIRGIERLELAFVSAGPGLAALADLPHLREVALVGTEGVTPELLRALPAGLQVLDLSACKQLDDSIGPILRDRFPHLEILRLNALEITDLAAIAQMKTLRELEVGFCQKLGAAAGAALRQCDFLRRLDISWCNKLPADVQTHLQQRGVAVRRQHW